MNPSMQQLNMRQRPQPQMPPPEVAPQPVAPNAGGAAPMGTPGAQQRQAGQQMEQVNPGVAPPMAPAPVVPPTQPFSQQSMLRRPGQSQVQPSMPPPSGPMQQNKKPTYTV